MINIYLKFMMKIVIITIFIINIYIGWLISWNCDLSILGTLATIFTIAVFGTAIILMIIENVFHNIFHWINKNNPMRKKIKRRMDNSQM